jgi:LPXTG-motif cell wall-anchored protein
MKNPVTLSPRAALFIGAALLSTPAFAQDQTVAPPPVVSTAPATPAPAPAPAITFAPPAAQVQQVPAAPVAEAPAPARRATTTTARTTRTVTRSTTTTARPAPAPAAEPVAATPPPAAATPPITEPAPAPIAGPEQVAPAPEAAPVTEPAPIRQTPIWPFALLGALILAGALFFLLRRRRTEYDEVFEEEVYPDPAAAAGIAAEPVPVVAARPAPKAEPLPVISEPIEAEAHIAEAAKEDLAGVTGAAAPVAHRPWLEFGMRPVRAGTSEDEAMVEIELTVGNSGDMAAEDVRITTFMLADGDSSEVEKMLTGHHADEMASVSIAAGEGTRVDATFAAPKSEIGETFTPVVVADARYRLPDGTEGRTSAAFRIGRAGESGISPIGAMRPQIVDDVGAELDQLLERA